MEKSQNKKFFKSNLEMVVTITIFILCIMGFIYFGNIDYKKDLPKDNVLMNIEHKEVDINNVYEYVNATQANSFISRNNVIILFGSNNEWTGYYAKLLNEVAKEMGINKIYYYDITDDRERKNATYQNIVSSLNNYALHLDDNQVDLYAPTLLIKNKGVIVLFDDDTSYMHGNMTPSEYWNDYNTNLKINTLKEALKDYKG